MTCQQIVDFLADYLDDTLPPAEKAMFVSHLNRCPPCVAFLNTYNSGCKLAQAACADDCCDVPEELVQAILAARKAKS